MKKILYLHAGAEMYGADKVLLNLVKGIDKKIFEPIVVLPEEGELFDKLKELDIKVHVLGYPILRRKYFNIIGIIGYFANYFKYSEKLSKYVKENDIDIIHNNTTAVLEGIYVKLRTRKKLIWHVHEMIERPRVVYHFLNSCLKYFPSSVITVSKSVKNHYTNLRNSKKATVIYNGIDLKKYSKQKKETISLNKNQLGIPSDSNVIGMIGRINAIKGQDDFLEAVFPLLEKYKGVYAILAGGVFKGEESRKENLKQKIDKSKYKDRIILLDYVENTVDLYNLFDVFVLPSVGLDSFPTVALESMACQTPVVAYASGGVREMILSQYKEFLVCVGDKEQLSHKIDTLLNNDSLAENYTMDSYNNIIDNFSVGNYVKNFEKIYNNILEGH